MSRPTSEAPRMDGALNNDVPPQQEEREAERTPVKRDEERLDAESDAMRGEEHPPSAIKGRSGRERSTDLRLRFDPDITVMETPSYFLVMHGEEGDDEVEEFAVFDRLYEEAKKRSERVKALQTNTTPEVDTSEMDKECTFHPVVSAFAKRLGRYTSWNQFLQVQEDRKNMSQKHFQKRKEQLQGEGILPLFDDMPRKHSLRIIAYLEKERKYKGPVRGWRQRFREYMRKLQESDRLKSPMKKTSGSLTDTQSLHSGVIRDDAVFTRLYEEAQTREVAQRIILTTQLEKETREFYHPMTNDSEYWQHLRNIEVTHNENNNASKSNNSRSNNESNIHINSSGSNYRHLFCSGGRGNSSINNRSYSSPGNSSVFENLYRNSEEYRRRHELRVMEARSSQENFPFKPSTNPKSNQIIMERAMARARGELPDRSRKSLGHDNGTPETKVNTRFNADIFCSRLQRKEFERLERVSALKRLLQSEEASECTFRPSISRNSVSIAMERGYGNVIFSPPHGSPQGGHPLGMEDRRVQGTTATITPVGGFRSGGCTPQRQKCSGRQMQEQQRELGARHVLQSQNRSGTVSNNNRGGVRVSVREFGPKTPLGDDDKYISVLSSEIQDVLSCWTETVGQSTTLS